MTIVASGAISLGTTAGTDRSISAEFGGSQPHSMSEYYRDGSYSDGINIPSGETSIPASGSISFSDFYGTSATSYSVEPNGSVYIYDQNGTPTVTFNITGGSGSETVYWQVINGTTTNADFSGVNGSQALTSGSGSFNLSIANNGTESPETFTMGLYSDSGYSTLIAESGTITITDWRVSRSPTSVNEGGTVNFTIAGGEPNDNVYWQVINGTTTNGDFSGSINDGGTPISLNSSGTTTGASFSVSINDDVATEPAETFTVKIYSNSGRTNELAESGTVTINASDQPTYSVTAPASINEGSSGTMNVTTTNVADSTTLYWTVTPSGDFGTSSGSFTITSNAGSFSVTPTADETTEGPETGTIQIRTGSTSGTIVATDTFTINDTSTTPATYSLSRSPTGTIYEGDTVTITLTTTGVSNGTNVPYTVTGITSADLTSGSLTGNFTINSNTDDQTFTFAWAELSTESETFTLTLGSPANGENISFAVTDNLSKTTGTTTYNTYVSREYTLSSAGVQTGDAYTRCSITSSTSTITVSLDGSASGVLNEEGSFPAAGTTNSGNSVTAITGSSAGSDWSHWKVVAQSLTLGGETQETGFTITDGIGSTNITNDTSYAVGGTKFFEVGFTVSFNDNGSLGSFTPAMADDYTAVVKVYGSIDGGSNWVDLGNVTLYTDVYLLSQ